MCRRADLENDTPTIYSKVENVHDSPVRPHLPSASFAISPWIFLGFLDHHSDYCCFHKKCSWMFLARCHFLRRFWQKIMEFRSKNIFQRPKNCQRYQNQIPYQHTRTTHLLPISIAIKSRFQYFEPIVRYSIQTPQAPAHPLHPLHHRPRTSHPTAQPQILIPSHAGSSCRII